jgi:hypothetical protein
MTTPITRQGRAEITTARQIHPNRRRQKPTQLRRFKTTSEERYKDEGSDTGGLFHSPKGVRQDQSTQHQLNAIPNSDPAAQDPRWSQRYPFPPSRSNSTEAGSVTGRPPGLSKFCRAADAHAARIKTAQPVVAGGRFHGQNHITVSAVARPDPDVRRFVQAVLRMAEQDRQQAKAARTRTPPPA